MYYFLPHIKDDIYLNKPVKRVEQLPDKVKVTFEDGEVILCDRIIITVPIS